MNPIVYTVGHSNYTIDKFLGLLKQHGITAIIDVRSEPYSKYVPHFNQDNIYRVLKENNITYLHFPDEFGAKQKNDSVYVDNVVSFELVQESEEFKRGVNRLQGGLDKGFVIALMCTEKDVLKCHRFGMISRYLADEGFDVQHIFEDGSIKSHIEMECELITNNGKKPLFGDPHSLENEYQKLEKKVAYKNG